MNNDNPNFAITNTGQLLGIDRNNKAFFIFNYDLKIVKPAGFTDKNGVEAYDGDILKTSNKDERFDIWDGFEHGYTCITVPYKRFYPLVFSDWKPTEDENENSAFMLSQFCEIIGNKFKNPELLKHCNQK